MIGSGSVVIDASVSLKWALDDEESVEEALALRDHAIARGIRMLAPSLWLYEVTNGLVTAVQRGRISAEQGSLALSHLTSLGVTLADPDMDHCFRASLRHRVAAYDAAYLALAEHLGTVLWTGDRKFWNAIGPGSGTVRWIGDYPQNREP